MHTATLSVFSAGNNDRTQITTNGRSQQVKNTPSKRPGEKGNRYIRDSKSRTHEHKGNLLLLYCSNERTKQTGARSADRVSSIGLIETRKQFYGAHPATYCSCCSKLARLQTVDQTKPVNFSDRCDPCTWVPCPQIYVRPKSQNGLRNPASRTAFRAVQSLSLIHI